MPTEKVLSSLIINEVDTVETLDKMYAAGLIKDDELYLVKEPANTDVVDFEPIKDSQNLVTSGGVFKAIEEKATNIPITDNPTEDVVIWIDPNEESDDSFYTKGEVDRLIEGLAYEVDNAIKTAIGNAIAASY